MNHRFDHNGVTLVELILALVLVSTIIITGLSMELGLRRIYSSTDLEVQLLGEAAPIMMMVTKDINRGVGDFTNPPFNTTTPSGWGADWAFRVRLDANNNGMADSVPPDVWVGYRYRGTSGPDSYQLWRYPNASAAGYTVLSNKVVAHNIGAPVNGVSSFYISLRKDPAQPINYTNPQISVNSSAQYRGYSLN